MIRPTGLAALAALVAAADPPAATAAAPAFSITAQEFVYSQRIEFVLGDGSQPFADEDQRRAQIVLSIRATGRLALLGWGAFTVGDARSDRDEDLAVVPVQPEGVFTASHDIRTDPTATLPALSLPVSRQPVTSLVRLDGSAELRWAQGDPTTTRFAIADLPANQDRPLPGLDGGLVALTSVPGADAQITVRLSTAAFLAVQDVVFTGADGKPLTVKNRRPEWRDDQGQLNLTLKGPAPAAAEVRWYQRIERTRVPFALRDLGLRSRVPGRDELRGPARTGAAGF